MMQTCPSFGKDCCGEAVLGVIKSPHSLQNPTVRLSAPASAKVGGKLRSRFSLL
jgi:hypothetical protein